MMILELLLVFFTILFFLIFFKRNPPHELPPSPKSLPIIGHFHLLQPLLHRSFRDISSTYGPLFHLKLGSVSCIVASTPDLAKQLLKTHELTFSSRKHSLAIDSLTYSSSFAFAPYGPYWKFIKKMSTLELLGPRMLNQFLPVRTKELHIFLQEIYAKSKIGNASVNVAKELMKLSNNIFSQMMLSIRSSGTDEQAEVARKLVCEVTEIFGEFNVSDFFLLCRNLDLQGFKKRIGDIHMRYDELLEKIIMDREQLRKKKKEMNGEGEFEVKDFLDMLLDVMEDESSEVELKRNHIKALILDFLTAATDTTSISIEWALAELINNPKVLKKAQEEINIVVGNHRIVHESDIQNLPYTQAIIKETLRLHPPIPMVARKSTQDCKIHGYTIPPNTLLFVNNWAIGRDPKYWKDPLKFKPERFLKISDSIHDEDGIRDVKGQHFELLPFGTGRRSCPGMHLAMQELPATLAAMIQCFDWKIAGAKDGDDHVLDMNERPGLTAPRAHDLVCTPVPRMLICPHLDPLAVEYK